MKRMLMLAAGVAALCAIAEPAQARDGWTVTTNGPRGQNWTTVVTPHAGGSIAQIIEFPPMTQEMMDRDAKWLEFCKPLIVARAPDWVRRYVYEQPGCENGRTE